MSSIKKFFVVLYRKWKYRNIDYNVCGCGSEMSPTKCAGGLNVCTSMKEYLIYREDDNESL